MSEAKRESFSIQVLQVLDALLVLAALWLVAAAWNAGLNNWVASLGWFRVNARGASPGAMVDVLFLAVPFIPLILELFGFYKSSGRQRKGSAVLRLLQAHVVMLVALALLTIFLKFEPHRPTLILGMVCSMALIGCREYLLSLYYRSGRKSEASKKYLLLAGNLQACEDWWKTKEDQLDEMYKVVGRFDLAENSVFELSDLLKETSAERVVFFVRDCPFDQVTAAMEECEIQGVEVWLSADFVRSRIAQPSFDSFGDTPMLVLRSTPSLSWSLLAKACIDRAGAAVLLLLGAIPMLLVAIGIKLSDRGPVFFKQDRAGRYGKPFKMWKFRTMVVDAEAKLAELKEQSGNQMEGPVFKLDHDPRIFALGHILRKFSIDELPQLFNVLLGDMSLVGPRPMALYELPEIEKSEHRRKLSVKPGITCIWQVSGRNQITSFDDWVKLDLQYIDNWSLWLDVKILFQTIPAVLFAKGAK